jgi:hypothetical protein
VPEPVALQEGHELVVGAGKTVDVPPDVNVRVEKEGVRRKQDSQLFVVGRNE